MNPFTSARSGYSFQVLSSLRAFHCYPSRKDRPSDLRIAKNRIEPQIEYYPNQYRSEIWISVKNLQFDKGQVMIWNMFGNIILDETVFFDESNDVIKLDLSSIADGVYSVRFSADDYVNIQKIIKK